MISGFQIKDDAPKGVNVVVADVLGLVSVGLESAEVVVPSQQESKINSAQESLEASFRRHDEIKHLESTFLKIKALKDTADTKLERAIKEKNKAFDEVRRLEEFKQNSGVRTINAMHHLSNGDSSNATTTARILNSMPPVTQPKIGMKLRLARIALDEAQKDVNEKRALKMDLLKQAMPPIELSLKINREILGKDLADFVNPTNEMDEMIQEIALLQLPLSSDSEIRRFLAIREKNQKDQEDQSLVTTVSDWFMRTMRLS